MSRFEPQPEFARRLAEVCRTIGLDNVRVEAKAVYSHSGDQELFVPAGHSPGASLTHKAAEATSFTTLSVPVVALDDYFDANDKITLLKIDVEGAELGPAARARSGFCASTRRSWCSNAKTAISRPAHVGDVFSYLKTLGYEGSFVCRDRLFPIAEFDAAVHQRQDGEWFWKSKDYCNNFVFRKAPARSSARDSHCERDERISSAQQTRQRSDLQLRSQ